MLSFFETTVTIGWSMLQLIESNLFNAGKLIYRANRNSAEKRWFCVDSLWSSTVQRWSAHKTSILYSVYSTKKFNAEQFWNSAD